MKKLLILLFATLVSGFIYGQSTSIAEEREVQKVVVDMFEVFSKYDPAILKKCVTDDVLVLEHGIVWNMDTLIVKLERPRPADYKRINSLKFIQTEVKGDMSFVTYHNHAEIRANGKDRIVDWLESAVLVKKEKLWKIKMLHSTRLAEKK